MESEGPAHDPQVRHTRANELQEAQAIYVFNQSRAEDATWAVNTFGFAPESATPLMALRPGHLMFKYGSNPETHIPTSARAGRPK